MGAVEVEDRTLLDRTVSGDVGALETLMKRHSARVYRLAYGIARNHADAEEIVQDVFLTLVNKGASFEGHATLTTWMYRVTTNAALNKRRGKRRELEVSLEEHLPTFREDGHREGDRSYVLAGRVCRSSGSSPPRCGRSSSRPSRRSPTTIAPC